MIELEALAAISGDETSVVGASERARKRHDAGDLTAPYLAPERGSAPAFGARIARRAPELDASERARKRHDARVLAARYLAPERASAPAFGARWMRCAAVLGARGWWS
jgi:hypothetical protein